MLGHIIQLYSDPIIILEETERMAKDKIISDLHTTKSPL